MGAIEKLLELNFSSVFLTLCVLLLASVAILSGVSQLVSMVKKPIKWIGEKQKDHNLILQNTKNIQELSKKHIEDTNQSIKHDEIIRENLQSLTIKVNDIANKIEIMQEKIDATEMAKLKDKILGYYRKYKDLGEWEKFESDAFWGLYDRYISHGGNSFVKDDIEPVMRELRIKD